MGSKIDFDKVYNDFKPKVLHYISRLTGNHDAEDITQEVFEKISRGLESFKGESKLSTWIYRVATNTAIDRLKSPVIKRTSDEHTKEAEDKSIWTDSKKTPVDQQLIRKEMSECVTEYIDKLSPDYKTVIILSEIEGFKNREIADILQLSIETVKIRLHRARASLKKELDNGCDFYHNEQNNLACDRKESTLIEFKSPPKSQNNL
jgi:RNA polymerase sigma-70 factor (ECF subfamily)